MTIAMSEVNVDTVLRCYAAYNRQDADGAIADFHPDAEYRVADALDKPIFYKGRDAIRDLFLGIWADWAEDVSEPRQTFDLGDRVLVQAVERRVGRQGIFVESHGGQLWTLDQAGLIVSFEAFDRWSDALHAAGLEE
jgi:ketosteroid isomerase-like protein